ncbi:MAG: PDZ domain-containing protein, partial [Myxococcota bacterium]
SQFGLKAGDTILRVDGEDVTSLGLGKTVELIRGEEGAAVTLEIQREGEPYPFEVGIDRGRVVFEEKDDGSKQ